MSVTVVSPLASNAVAVNITGVDGPSLPVSFSPDDPVPVDVVSGIVTAILADGSMVEVTGGVDVDNDVATHFSSPQHVIIDSGAATSVTVSNDVTTHFASPPHVILDSGTVTVTNPGGQAGTFAQSLEYEDATPYIQTLGSGSLRLHSFWLDPFYGTNVAYSAWTEVSSTLTVLASPLAGVSWWLCDVRLQGRNNFGGSLTAITGVRLLQFLYSSSCVPTITLPTLTSNKASGKLTVESASPVAVVDWNVVGNSTSAAYGYAENSGLRFKALMPLAAGDVAFTLRCDAVAHDGSGASNGWWSYVHVRCLQVDRPASVAYPSS